MSPVYVDHMKARVGRLILCHMVADTTDELLAMVDAIGVARKWMQDAGNTREHFDISLGKRKLAVERGAIEVTGAQLMTVIRSRTDKVKDVKRAAEANAAARRREVDQMPRNAEAYDSRRLARRFDDAIAGQMKGLDAPPPG